MLNYARQRALEALKIPQKAVLATSGPAGVQAGEFPCEAAGLCVYLWIPRTSDQLFNLEQNAAVTLLTHAWELKGTAQIVQPGAAGFEADLLIKRRPDEDWLEWCVLVRVEPAQVQIRREAGWGNCETIDFEG